MPKFFPQAFEDTIGALYNADLMDWDLEREQIIEIAEFVVYALLSKKIGKAELVSILDNAIDHWGPEVITEFSQATSVPWYEDQELKNLLKDILLRMLETAREAPDPLPESLRKAMFSGEM